MDWQNYPGALNGGEGSLGARPTHSVSDEVSEGEVPVGQDESPLQEVSVIPAFLQQEPLIQTCGGNKNCPQALINTPKITTRTVLKNLNTTTKITIRAILKTLSTLKTLSRSQ